MSHSQRCWKSLNCKWKCGILSLSQLIKTQRTDVTSLQEIIIKDSYYRLLLSGLKDQVNQLADAGWSVGVWVLCCYPRHHHVSHRSKPKKKKRVKQTRFKSRTEVRARRRLNKVEEAALSEVTAAHSWCVVRFSHSCLLHTDLLCFCSFVSMWFCWDSFFLMWFVWVITPCVLFSGWSVGCQMCVFVEADCHEYWASRHVWLSAVASFSVNRSRLVNQVRLCYITFLNSKQR